MPRRFNTTGTCDPARHYTLPPLARLEELRRLVDEQAYFTVHAPRQTGKTTTLLALARALTEEGRYAAVLVSMITGQGFGDDLRAAEDAILTDWYAAAEWQLPPELRPPPWPDVPVGRAFAAALQTWAESIARPLVVFVDEIDVLPAPALVSFLGPLKSQHPYRPEHFPWSVGLIGMRDVRGELSMPGGHRVDVTSLFNIKARALVLPGFSREAIGALYGQHTEETGQRFAPEAVERVSSLTRGQPWLVNALGRALCEEAVSDRAQAITAADVDRAAKGLLERRDAHLDALAARLGDGRVRPVVEALWTGRVLSAIPEEDIDLCLDLGLLQRAETGGLEVCNPLYVELMTRTLCRSIDAALGPTDSLARGLEEERLCGAYIDLLRRRGEALLAASPYAGAAPHLVLLSFLRRALGADAKIEPLFAPGSGRLEISIEHRDARLFIAVMTRREGEAKPLARGLAQLDKALSRRGLESAWLVIADQRSCAEPLEDRARASLKETPAGREVRVIRA